MNREITHLQAVRSWYADPGMPAVGESTCPGDHPPHRSAAEPPREGLPGQRPQLDPAPGITEIPGAGSGEAWQRPCASPAQRLLDPVERGFDSTYIGATEVAVSTCGLAPPVPLPATPLGGRPFVGQTALAQETSNEEVPSISAVSAGPSQHTAAISSHQSLILQSHTARNPPIPAMTRPGIGGQSQELLH